MTETQSEERATVAEQFGVDTEQVRRDHLISHVLAAPSAGVSTDDLVFFGGTAWFAAAKLAAWIERRASRDLYDLRALSERDLIDDAAVDVFVRNGPTRTASGSVGVHVCTARGRIA